MNHRELFDSMVGSYEERSRENQRLSFTDWCRHNQDGRQLLRKIDLLDSAAGLTKDEIAALTLDQYKALTGANDFAALFQRVQVLEAGFTLYGAHVENLIERVYDLEPHEPMMDITQDRGG